MEKTGFKRLVRPDVILHVQDALAIDFELPLGSAVETVVVASGRPAGEYHLCRSQHADCKQLTLQNTIASRIFLLCVVCPSSPSGPDQMGLDLETLRSFACKLGTS